MILVVAFVLLNTFCLNAFQGFYVGRYRQLKRFRDVSHRYIEMKMNQILSTEDDEKIEFRRNQVVSVSEETFVYDYKHLTRASRFIFMSGLIGVFTGLSIVAFKSAIAATSSLFYEDLANLLPKPYFYWPVILYPLLGSIIVSCLAFWKGEEIRNGIEVIAGAIDSEDFVAPTLSFLSSEQTLPSNVSTGQLTTANSDTNNLMQQVPKLMFIRSNSTYDPWRHLFRIFGSVATLGSGCSLGPEGPAVEIGAGWSRLISYFGCTSRERRHLFLAGTAAGVSAGFNAPIAGVFFALECGNRFLSKNTITLNEKSPDGPRADIAAIVTAAGLADIIVGLGLHESNALIVQGNNYAMASPFFELPLYVGLGFISGGISVVFTKLREIFSDIFSGKGVGVWFPFKEVPSYLHPIFGGLLCGIVALFYPQTLFVGYATLDSLIAGKIE